MGINMLLTIVAIVMLGVFVIFGNGLMADNVKVAEQNEFALAAIALAQSVLDEAKLKAFDENTVSGSVSSPSGLTPAASLGVDGAVEGVPNPDTLFSGGFRSAIRFDDIDDYNGYSRLVRTPRAEGYRINVSVGYASATYPDSSRGTQTYCKRMTLTVTSPYIDHPIRLMYAFTY